MKQSAKTVVGGMTAALSAVLMLFTVIPVFEYTLPAFAGAMIMFTVIELDKRWAFGVYVAVSLVSFLTAPDKEAAMMYIAFFGYYPILKSVFESKLPRVAEYVLKFLVFNVAIIAAYAVLIKFMGFDINEFAEFFSKTLSLKVAIPVLLGLGNIVFIAYDVCLTGFAGLYIRRWQQRFRRLFKF